MQCMRCTGSKCCTSHQTIRCLFLRFLVPRLPSRKRKRVARSKGYLEGKEDGRDRRTDNNVQKIVVGDAMIILPWPDKSLSPNARVHWATKAKAAKAARQSGFYAATITGLNRSTFSGYDGYLHLWIDFYAKTRNYPDADNCLSAIKANLDGIADALGINDRRFVHHPFVKDETGGKVIIRITRGFED